MLKIAGGVLIGVLLAWLLLGALSGLLFRWQCEAAGHVYGVGVNGAYCLSTR